MKIPPPSSLPANEKNFEKSREILKKKPTRESKKKENASKKSVRRPAKKSQMSKSKIEKELEEQVQN